MTDESGDQSLSIGITGVGTRIRQFRQEKDMSLSQLAETSNVSKGYLSALENADGPDRTAARRPSGKTLYAIAQALGVTMSDLLGRKLLTELPTGPLPESLRKFAEDYNLPAADLQMLSTIRFRGEPPRTAERWQYIYNAIRTSESIDKERRTIGRPGEEKF